jgi:hypothetical protein
MAKWIQKAHLKKGVEKEAASKAGESVHSYMSQHANSPGTAGKRARLGLEFEKMAGSRAFGGPVSPGKNYLVGEKGPELIRPREPGQVIPHGRPLMPHPRLPLQAPRAPRLPSQMDLHSAIMQGMGGGGL